MTNREWLHSLSDKQLAEFLTCGLYVRDLRPYIGNTPPISQNYFVSIRAITMRYTQPHTGLTSWLSDEQEYEAITEVEE